MPVAITELPAVPLQRFLPQASRLVMGCMGLGGGWDAQPLQYADVEKAQAATEAALAAGITLFDHANIYTLGKAEESFGRLFQRQPSLRQSLLLQSKCGIRFTDAHGPKRYDLSAQHIVDSVDEILGRLQTDYLDVLILHRPDPLMQPAEVAQAWQQIKAAGKARFLGVSNMHAAQMGWLQQALGEPLVVNQLEMSLLKRDWLEAATGFNDTQGASYLAWDGTLKYAQQHGLQLQAWGALARGWFSGAAPVDAPPAVRRAAEYVQQLAQVHGVAAEAIVLAWLMQHPARIQPVVGTTDPPRIRACAQSTNVALSRGEWYQLFEAARGRELP
ncbi:aldo/keto reductase family oxidoreductase [Rhodoferax sp.]|uniref:aldo/keto reductase n=1 Tax=Rhodoferax sp. TaxID=50421 RepID=UPI00374D268E